jgi:sugar/nucleoside kinase (ribokinase family)
MSVERWMEPETQRSALSTAAVDYLLIGHVCVDLTDDGERLGGTVAYAGLAAQRQGWRVGIVTSAASALDLAARLPGISVHCVPASATTRFRNAYGNGERQQVLLARAAPLGLADVPPAWRGARVVHLAPVAREVDLALVAALTTPGPLVGAAPGRLVGATPQGWLRQWDAAGVVTAAPAGDWPERLRGVTAVALSEEDLAAEPRGAERLAAAGPLVALTRGALGVRVMRGAESWAVPACPARPRDPTGAGDVFAAVWFVRLALGDDILAATRYAAGAAACAVEQPGLAGVPTADAIEERLAHWAA